MDYPFLNVWDSEEANGRQFHEWIGMGRVEVKGV